MTTVPHEGVPRGRENGTPHLCRDDLSERRVICHALRFWQARQIGDALPHHDAIDLTQIPEQVPYVYVVHMPPLVAEPQFAMCGGVLAEWCRGNPLAGPVRETLLPALRDHMLSYQMSAASYREALADSGSFMDSDGIEYLYRHVVMPLAGDTGAVAGVFGAFNYRRA